AGADVLGGLLAGWWGAGSWPRATWCASGGGRWRVLPVTTHRAEARCYFLLLRAEGVLEEFVAEGAGSGAGGGVLVDGCGEDDVEGGADAGDQDQPDEADGEAGCDRDGAVGRGGDGDAEQDGEGAHEQPDEDEEAD